MDTALGELMPVDFLSCDLSEDDHGLGSSHDGEQTPSQGSPLSPMLTMTEGTEEIQIVGSNNSAGDGSGDEQTVETMAPQRDYVNRGSELWNHWSWLGGQGKMSLMKCNYCSNKQLKNAPKCRRHLIKCPGTPDNIRRIFEKREFEANRVSAVMREIRDRGIKVSRATAGAHLLANDLPAAITPQSQSKAQFNKSLLNSSAPASILKSQESLDTSDNSSARGRRKRKSTNVPPPPPTPPTSVPSRMNGITHVRTAPDSFDLVKSILAPYHAQSTVPPLPNSQHGNTIASQKHKATHNSSSSSTPVVNVPTTASPNVGDFSLSSLAALSGGSNPLLNDPNFLALYLASIPMVNGNNADNNGQQQDLTKSSAASLAAVLSGVTTNSLKRKNSSANNGRENSILLNQSLNLSTKNGKENKQKKVAQNSILNSQGMNGNTVVIHVDDGPRMDESIFLPTTVTPPPPLEPVKKRKIKADIDVSNILSKHFETPKAINRARPETNQTELNDLLSSALLSAGISFDFVNNPFMKEFIHKLSTLNEKSYRLPAVDELIRTNLPSLARRFDNDTVALFNDADYIVVSFDTVKFDSVIDTEKMNTHLYIQRSEKDSTLLYKCFDLSGNTKDLKNHIDSTINKIEPHRIFAVVLPYENQHAAAVISSYIMNVHQHIVPLTNAYQLFDHMLADICRVEPIRIVLQQCIAMFQVFVRHFKESDENRLIWTKVFTSQHLKMYQHLMISTDDSKLKNCRYWFSMHMMLHWFLVSKTDLPERISKTQDCSQELNVVMKNVNLDSNDISKFFDKIDALFHFITPFILVIHKIQFESSVISDIVKIFYDLKASFEDNNIMRNMDSICDTDESRASLDEVLTRYIQEDNFSDFYFLAYYLDPRYKSDKQIEENDDLIRRVHFAMELYSNSLGCHGDTENDDSTQMTKSLPEVLADFRNDVKMFCNSGSTQSPSKYWNEMCRFQMPGVTPLAFCASRLLSISTRPLLLSAHDYSLNPEQDNNANELRLLNDDKHGLLNLLDSRVVEQLLPIKNHLSREQNTGNDRADTKLSFSRESLAQTVSNVIQTLDAFNSFLSRHQRDYELRKRTASTSSTAQLHDTLDE